MEYISSRPLLTLSIYWGKIITVQENTKAPLDTGKACLEAHA